MGIVVETTYAINCDTCGTDYDWRLFDGMRDARRVIRDAGWGVKGTGKATRVYCPEHNDFDNGGES